MPTHPCDNELCHIAGDATERAAEAKDAVREQQTFFPAKGVTASAINGLGRSQSEEIGRGDPAGQV